MSTINYLELTSRNEKAILAGFPDTGQQWIDNFPSHVEQLLDRWSLRVVGRAQGGWPTNVVYFVEDKNGAPCVLKLGHPSPESLTESYVLRKGTGFDNGLVDVIEADVDGNALLLPMVRPGTTLRESILQPNDINAALNLYVRIPSPVNEHDAAVLPSYRIWLEKAFQEYDGLAQARDETSDKHQEHIGNAKKIFHSMASEPARILHGDLHHENILKKHDGWMAIDPKGVIGPARLECGRFFHNFLADEIDVELTVANYQSVLERRFESARDALTYSRLELIEVTYVDLTLATTWHLNSKQDATEASKMLSAMRSIWNAAVAAS